MSLSNGALDAILKQFLVYCPTINLFLNTQHERFVLGMTLFDTEEHWDRKWLFFYVLFRFE